MFSKPGEMGGWGCCKSWERGASQESFSSWQPGDLKDATATAAAAFTVHDDADAEIIMVIFNMHRRTATTHRNLILIHLVWLKI